MHGCPVLILAPLGRDASVIESALSEAGLETWTQPDLATLVANLNYASTAVITEEALTRANKAQLAHWINGQPSWSDFPFILLIFRKRDNGASLSDIIELLGNVTILERPLALTSLKSAVRAAARARARQRQSEQHLRDLQEAAATLETRVRERTFQLETMNARLLSEIAEREKTEAALRQSQKMEAVGQLTGGVAHDFNNLLMAVLGNLELLRPHIQDGRLLKYATNAIAAANRGATLVKQLLAFSRKQRLSPEVTIINDLVSEMEELISRTIGSDIRMQISCDPNLWPALVDPTQLELMILNLAINARDAMPKGGTLTLETKNLEYPPPEAELAPGQYICIGVSDTGHGMPPDVIARIFEPFFTTKPPGKGTGLGLSQVYGFAKQSGGGVRVESEPGHGTAVRIFLPRAHQPLVSQRVNQSIHEGSPPPSILLVDDDQQVLQTASSILEDLGYKVISASDSEAALVCLGSNEVDAALIDLMMPDVSGFELATQIRELRPKMPILFCSGFPESINTAHRELSESNFIAKPYRAYDLAAKLRRILESSA
jgi:signal transduction histidine kinase